MLSLSIDCIIILGCIVTVVRGDQYDGKLRKLPENVFSVSKLLTYGPKMTYGANCWLAPEGQDSAEFVLDLGCKKPVDTVELVNTPNGNEENRSMKEFKVFLSDSSDGDWGEAVVHGTLGDSRRSRRHPDPRPVKRFPFKKTEARFIKFQQNSFYGDGGGLQYFAVIDSGEKKSSVINVNLLIIIIMTLFRPSR